MRAGSTPAPVGISTIWRGRVDVEAGVDADGDPGLDRGDRGGVQAFAFVRAQRPRAADLADDAPFDAGVTDPLGEFGDVLGCDVLGALVHHAECAGPGPFEVVGHAQHDVHAGSPLDLRERDRVPGPGSAAVRRRRGSAGLPPGRA
jgi:hypothetical protein